ncbi:phage holin [Salinicoccus albus]|uniref:phage holin n=1 Tax=Salinicoccus albus TaxID=418756 RepID=UPI00037C1BC5|nr:phage holin [Salinicoccus albus]
MAEQKRTGQPQVDSEVKNSAAGDLIRHIAAILLAASSFLGVLGYQFDWLTQDSINAFVVVLYAVAGFAYTAFEIYKNKFATKKGKQQKKVLKDNKVD